MEIHWAPEATADFTHIIQYIRQDNVSAALRIGRTIYQKIHKLQSFPKMGRLGRVEGTRELPFPPLPFVVIYRIKQNVIEIARVLHGAQRWP